MELKDAPTILISIIVTVMLFGAMMLAFDGFKASSGVYTSIAETNRSFTSANNTFVGFSAAGHEVLAVSAIRYSNQSVLGTQWYTLSISTGRVNITSLDQTYYVDYTHKGGNAYNITKSGETSLTNMSTNLPTVGTMIGITLLIGLLVGMFMRFRNR